MSSALDMFDTPEEALEAILRGQANIIRRLEALENVARSQPFSTKHGRPPTFWSEPELDFN